MSKKKSKKELTPKPMTYLKLSPKEIKEYKKKGILNKDKIQYREREIVKEAQKSLKTLFEVVYYSAHNNPKRLKKIFDPISFTFDKELEELIPQEYSGELALKMIVAYTSYLLDDKHRLSLLDALQDGFAGNSTPGFIKTIKVEDVRDESEALPMIANFKLGYDDYPYIFEKYIMGRNKSFDQIRKEYYEGNRTSVRFLSNEK